VIVAIFSEVDVAFTHAARKDVVTIVLGELVQLLTHAVLNAQHP
jgi:hypothetical protein